MLSFVESLKNIIADIEDNGGNPVQRISPSANLVLYLKSYAINRLKNEPEPLSNRVSDYILEEFNEGFFEEGVNASLVHLTEMGFTNDTEIRSILCQVIDKRINDIFGTKKQKEEWEKQKNSEDYESGRLLNAIVQSVKYVWEDLGSVPSSLYTFARQRFLITWSYRKNQWQITGLGRFFLELTPLQAIIFLLTIDTILSTGETDFKHISGDQLYDLLRNSGPSNPYKHRLTLEKLGILRRPSWYEDEFESTVTPLGKSAIQQVLSEQNPMYSIVVTLMEGEELGTSFESTKKELKKLHTEINQDEIDNATKASIQNAISLYESGSYVDSLRILFPSIESIATRMLVDAGEDVLDRKKFPGLSRKISRLEELQLLSADLAQSIEITTSRNKILHGEYRPHEQEYAYPLCVAAIVYLRRMLVALKSSANFPQNNLTQG